MQGSYSYISSAQAFGPTGQMSSVGPDEAPCCLHAPPRKLQAEE